MQLKKNTSLIVFLFFIFANFLFAEEIGGSTTKQLSSQASLGDEQRGSSTTSLPDKIIAGF
ncbi:hypothetical protein fh0823_19210 [Francisella halioticida]|uniref:Uncharacterized protein n=1 Tax=Francisella halioticida TaxID=549298 RepID=A0ABM6M1H1_9GAMM|nr:hypothetical protein [Francisella halioticida]ASG68808.1 hypothetical protein CDV26_10825 [Francisella halioticida]BCD91782.1 hypothetical protein fh0823_19210 [Francisella halioticida]